MRDPAGIFFDLDGTLIDTAPDFLTALNRLLRAHQRQECGINALRATISQGSQGMIQSAFSDIQEINQLDSLQDEFLTYYLEHLSEKSSLFPGFESLLDWFETQGIPWGIVTNKPHAYTERLLRDLQLYHRALITVSGDTLTVAKPDPLPLLYACEQIGVDPKKSVYIGDAERDIIAGNRAGMTTILALFGYLGPEDTPHAWGADILLETPLHLVNWLKQWHKP